MTAFFAWKWHSGQLASMRLSKSAMAFDLTRLSPRGWAVLVVVAGSAIASVFLRRDNRPNSGLSVTVDNQPRKMLVEQRQQRTILSEGSLARTHEHSPPAQFQLPPTDSIPYPKNLVSPQPVTTEFPTWARKPSLLDALIENPSQSSASTVRDLPNRSPTPFQSWASQNSATEHAGRSIEGGADRHTPFSESSHGMHASPIDTAQLVWPDADLPERSNLEPFERTSQPNTELVGSRQLDTALTINSKVSAIANEETAKKPKTIGASLRSHSVPSRELFIHQPGLHK